jgi:DNA (cytosine-5)-methyltransferase 1
LYCIDLFAGAGGLSTGLKMAGFKPLFANELSEIYAKTLKSSHNETFVEAGDIQNINAANIRRSLQLKRGDLHLLAGGPPCQGFSVNAPVRSVEDKRNHLFRDYLRFADEFLPQAILIENVPGMLSFEKGSTVLNILSILKSMGYEANIRILYAPHYGVPQMRWRTIIMANRLGVDPLLMFPVPTHRADGRANFTTKLLGQQVTVDTRRALNIAKLPFVTVSDAISDLPEIKSGGGANEAAYLTPPKSEFQNVLRGDTKILTNHQCAGLGTTNLERITHIPQGGSWRDIPFELLPKGMQRARRSDHTKRYGRLHPKQIASTILTKCDPHWGAYIHPEQNRVLSVREAARIQSFPDHVKFAGNITEQYAQVGNAVPPLFAKAIGERISNVLFLKDAMTNINMNPDDTFWLEDQLDLGL